MGSRVRFADDPEIDSRIRSLIDSARLIARKQFSAAEFPKFDFESARWDLNRARLAWQVRPLYAHFYDAPTTELRSQEKRDLARKLPPEFAEVLKAWLVHTDRSSSYICDNAQSARVLWSCLRESRRGRKAAPFRWDRLSAADFAEAARVLEARLPKAARHHESAWSVFIGWLHRNELIAENLEWTPTARTKHHTTEHRAERAKKIPSRRILEALAAIYREHAVNPIDRLLICCIGLLLTCGFRISELLSLPADCLFTESWNGRERVGIRYWNQKTKDRSGQHAVRWLSPLGAELAKKLVAEILELTADARKQARRIERNGGTVRIPWFGRRKVLTREEAARALGLVPWSIAPLMRNGFLKLTPIVQGYHDWRYSREEVEAELTRRCPPLNVYRSTGAKYQTLSESLLVSFVYATDPQATTSPLLVRTLPASSIELFIGAFERTTKARLGARSAFARFGFDVDGEAPLRFHTHMMRHWLNTVANKAGMTAFQITIWMGRESVLQSLLYLHDTAEIADLSREILRDGRAAGVRADEFRATAEHLHEDYLRTIRFGHQTRSGLCVDDLARTGCGRQKACDLECRSFLAIRGDASALPALMSKLDAFREAIRNLEQMRKAGRKIVPRQRTQYRNAITQVELQIAIAKEKAV